MQPKHCDREVQVRCGPNQAGFCIRCCCFNPFMFTTSIYTNEREAIIHHLRTRGCSESRR